MSDCAGVVHGVRVHGPYAACVAVAAALRLADLGRAPLSAAESTASWAAWAIAAGHAPVLPLLADPPESAALFGFQAAAFWLLGDGDAVARLAPACAGIAAVLLPWILRDALGRLPSIALAALLALDPLLAGYARLADGAALTMCAVWAIVLLAGVAGAPGHRGGAAEVYRDLLGGAAGLLLISGPLAWDVVPPLVLLLAVLEPGRQARVVTARTVIVMLLTALVLSTSGFTQWDGPQLVSAAMTAWLRAWVAGAGPHMGAGWRVFLRMEFVPLALAAAGLAVASLRRDRPPDDLPLFRSRALAVYGLWLLWGLLLTARPDGSASTWLVMVPPLLLCAAYAVWRLSSGLPGRGVSPARAVPAGAAAALLLLAQMGVVRTSSEERETSWRPWPDATAPGVRHLVRDVAVWRHQTGAGLDIVAPSGPDPVLGWHLRHEPDIRWTASPAAQPAAGRGGIEIAPGTLAAGEQPGAAYPLRAIDGRRQVVSVRTRGAS